MTDGIVERMECRALAAAGIRNGGRAHGATNGASYTCGSCMSVPPLERPPPTERGAFQLYEVLGEGGSGTVYAASWKGEQIALKVLREDATPSDRECRRFVDEAARIRRVTHPGLVELLDAGTLPDGRPYLAMPLLRGETLGARLSRGPLELAPALAIFDQLAAAVAVLHAAGIIHRDIKPENVFLHEGNGAERAILLDFGIARELSGDASTTTQAGVIRGTPAYMAPERFFGTPAAVASDVYELSVVLYMMLVGKLPWDGTQSAGRLQPRHPSESGVCVPPRLANVLLKAMSTRPEARPATTLLFARAVHAAAAGLDETASASAPRRTADTAAEHSASEPCGVLELRVAPTRRRSGGRSTAIAAALIVVAGGAVALGRRATNAKAPPPIVAFAVADERPSAPKPAVIAAAARVSQPEAPAAVPPAAVPPSALPPSAVPPSAVLPPTANAWSPSKASHRPRHHGSDAGNPPSAVADGQDRFYKDRK